MIDYSSVYFAQSNIVTATPLKYYCYLRREGYRPRLAAVCTLMHFCPNAEDLHRRAKRWPIEK